MRHFATAHPKHNQKAKEGLDAYRKATHGYSMSRKPDGITAAA
jgi:hypothetical protein